MISSVWKHKEGLGVLFVLDAPFDKGPFSSPSIVAAWWVDVNEAFCERVPAFADRQYPRPGFEERLA